MSIASGVVSMPTQKVAEPEMDVIVGKLESVLQPVVASAMRPPQPVGMRCDACDVCQQSIWSECENSE